MISFCVANFKKIFIVVGVVLLLVLRFSFILRSPLYLDEGIYISWADLIHQSKSFAYLSLQDGKTPLFFWIMSVFGPFINNFLLSGRLVSIFAGLVTVGCWMIIFSKYFNFKKAVIYLFLFLIAPYGFLIERMALSDSLLMSFFSLSLMFLILSKKIFDGNDKKNKFKFVLFMVFSGIFMGCSYATKTTTRLFFITYLIIAGFWILGYLKNKKIKNIILMIFGLMVFVFLYREVISCFRVGGHVFWSSIAEKEKLMIYSPQEIIKRLTNNPLSVFNYSNLVFQYWGAYLSGLMIFVVIGTYKLISLKENRKFLWLLFYWVFVTAAVCLSGKVMASRYIYITYPIMLAIAVFGVDFLLSLKNQKIKIVVYLLMVLVLGQSCLFVFKPERAFYSEDDQSYFVSSGLTALGLSDVIKYFDNKDKSKVLIGVCGTWGIPEGSSIILKEAGLKSEIINVNNILSSKPLERGKCDKWWIKNGNTCWRLDFGIGDESGTVRYLFVAGDDKAVEKLLNVGAKKIYQFDRYKGMTKNYFLEVPNLLNN